MDTALDRMVIAHCVAAVDSCIKARNELGLLNYQGVSFNRDSLGVCRLTSGRIKRILNIMANYGIKDASYHPWGEVFKGTLKLEEAVISPTNIPLTRLGDGVPQADEGIPHTPSGLFEPKTLFGDMNERLSAIMNTGLGVEITADNRTWAEGEYQARLLAATGVSYAVKLDRKNRWTLSVTFDNVDNTTS